MRMAMYQIGQLKRRSGQDGRTSVELYWLDTARDVPALCEVLLNHLPKLQASTKALFQVFSSNLRHVALVSTCIHVQLPCFLLQTQSESRLLQAWPDSVSQAPR